MESPENRGFGVLSVALMDHGPEFFAKKYRHEICIRDRHSIACCQKICKNFYMNITATLFIVERAIRWYFSGCMRFAGGIFRHVFFCIHEEKR